MPLRYPLRFGGSRSAVASCPPPAGDLGCACRVFGVAMRKGFRVVVLGWGLSADVQC